jgi:hypothetical protein
VNVKTGRSLTIRSGNTLTVNYTAFNTAVRINGALNFQAGGSNKLVIQSPNWITCALQNLGTITPSTGTIEFSGSQTGMSVIGAVPFYNVIVTDVQQMNFGAFCTFGNLLTIRDAAITTVAGTVLCNDITATEVANLQLSGAGTVISGTLRLNNSLLTGGYPVYGPDGTLELNTTATVNGNDYNWPPGSGATVPDHVKIVGGSSTFMWKQRYIKKTLTVMEGATFNGALDCYFLPATFAGITNSGTITLGGVTVQAGATWSLSSNCALSTLQIEAGGTVNCGTYTLSMDAAANNCNGVNGIMEVETGGTFNAGTGNIVFDPPYWMPVTGTITFNNVSVVGNNTLTIPANSDITLNGNLSIASNTTVNHAGNISFNPGSSVSNSGTISGNPVPSGIPFVTLASGSSGGGVINAGRWMLLSPTVFTVTDNITFTSSPQIVTIQEGAEMDLGSFTITCDSVYVYGSVKITHAGGLAGAFGTAKVVFGSNASLNYAADSAIQSVTPASYHQLVLSGNATKVFDTGTYNISGDFIHSGGATVFEIGSTVQFNGSTQAIAGGNFHNLNIVNNGTKTLNGPTRVRSLLNVTSNAVLASAGYLTLGSDATATAAVGPLTGTSDITGNVTVERYIPAAGRKWRFMACQVSNASLASGWQNQIHVTGPGTGGSLGTTNSNGFDWTQSAAPSIFWYNENQAIDYNSRWQTIPNTSVTIPPGRGYRIFIRGDKVQQGVSLINGSSYTPLPVTLSASSTLNKGTIPIALTCSNGCTANDGWNLVGNPYPSAIDWNDASWMTERSANIGQTIYVFNPVNNQWSSWNPFGGSVNGGSSVIGSGQAFFVKVTGSATLNFKEQYKTSNLITGIFGKASAAGRILVSLYDTALLDETVVYLQTNATKDVEDPYDGYKPALSDNSISSYTSVNLRKLIFNAIHAPGREVTDTIFLHTPMPALTATRTLLFSGSSSFTHGITLYLVDHFGNAVTQITESMEYSFEIRSSVPATYAANRFMILVCGSSNLPVRFGTVAAVRQYNKVLVNWTTVSEKDNDHFVVEKSADGERFVEAGRVKAAGFSDKVLSYSFTDDNPVNGTNYYRVRQVDRNNAGTLTHTVSVDLRFEKRSMSNLSVYPIPATTTLHLEGVNEEEIGDLTVTDLAGRELVRPGDAGVSIDVSPLVAGSYVLVVKLKSGEVQRHKFIRG